MKREGKTGEGRKNSDAGKRKYDRIG